MPIVTKKSIERGAGAFFGPGLMGAAMAAGKIPAAWGPIPTSVVAALGTGLLGTMAGSNILSGMSCGFTGMAGAQMGAMIGAPTPGGVSGAHGYSQGHSFGHPSDEDLLGWMDDEGWDDDYILGEEFDEEIEV